MSDKKSNEEKVNLAAEELSRLFVAHIDEKHPTNKPSSKIENTPDVKKPI